MRKGICVLLSVLALLLPVSAQTVFNEVVSDTMPVVLAVQGVLSGVRSPAIFSEYGLRHTPIEETVPLTVWQNDGAARISLQSTELLGETENLLYTQHTLETGNEQVDGDGADSPKAVTSRRLDADQPDYGRLIVFLTLWTVLILAGSYGIIILLCRQCHKKTDTESDPHIQEK